MYRYVVTWLPKDEEEIQFVQSQVCENREEAENFKYNLEVLDQANPESIKVYSLTEVTDI